MRETAEKEMKTRTEYDGCVGLVETSEIPEIGCLTKLVT